MEIISFAWTLPALLAGHKTVTRRNWGPAYRKRFREGMTVRAFDKRASWGGVEHARVRLTCDPYVERTSAMTESDFVEEGFAWLMKHPHLLPTRFKGVDLEQFFIEWKEADEEMTVVRFELVEGTRLPAGEVALSVFDSLLVEG